MARSAVAPARHHCNRRCVVAPDPFAAAVRRARTASPCRREGSHQWPSASARRHLHQGMPRRAHILAAPPSSRANDWLALVCVAQMVSRAWRTNAVEVAFPRSGPPADGGEATTESAAQEHNDDDTATNHRPRASTADAESMFGTPRSLTESVSAMPSTPRYACVQGWLHWCTSDHQSHARPCTAGGQVTSASAISATEAQHGRV